MQTGKGRQTTGQPVLGITDFYPSLLQTEVLGEISKAASGIGIPDSHSLLTGTECLNSLGSFEKILPYVDKCLHLI